MANRLSDHHPIVHHEVLFWNVMMQCKKRQDGGFNNGFGLIETDAQYIKRLRQIAQAIAEIIYDHSSIKIISLCEGPIDSVHVYAFQQALKRFPSMEKFSFDRSHQSTISSASKWGLFVFANKKYRVEEVSLDFIEDKVIAKNLANRFQLWRLSNQKNEKYLALGHFPFSRGARDEYAVNGNQLSPIGKKYCRMVNDLIKKYSDEKFILCADFNFNPYLISDLQHREGDKITPNNSILLTQQCDKARPITETVTVDGILLSSQMKRKYCVSRLTMGFFNRAHSLAELERNRHKDDKYQREYDKRYGLIGYLNQSSMISLPG